MNPRWVGFDMDECLGSFMSLWPFCNVLPQKAVFSLETKIAYLSRIADRLAFSDRVWLFRPELDPLLAALVQAKRKGIIQGCFILTNNGSAEITEVVRRMLNLRANVINTSPATAASAATAAKTMSELFVVGWHRYTPCRKRTGSILTKNLQCVQNCLADSGLPTLTDRQSLLYFDDFADHVLSKEIPHYVTVKAYFHYTPISLVYNEIRGIIHEFKVPKGIVDGVLEAGHVQEEKDLKSDKELIVYPPAENNTSFSLLRHFAHFLQGSPLAKSKGKSIGKGKGKSKGTTTTTRKAPTKGGLRATRKQSKK